MASAQLESKDDQFAHHVLLYYKYVCLSQPEALDAMYSFYVNVCQRDGLLGRVRVALDGVNVTVSFPSSQLHWLRFFARLCDGWKLCSLGCLFGPNFGQTAAHLSADRQAMLVLFAVLSES